MTTKERRKARKLKKRIKALERKEAGKNRHHIIPRSKKGKDFGDNIAIIDVIKHEKYHHLFSNRTPDEIINYLIDYFWNGQTQWVFEAIAKRR